MTHVSPRSSDRWLGAGIASAVVGEELRGVASRLVADPFVQPIYGRIASDERRAGFLAVAAIAERLSRTAGSTCLAFGDYLRGLCIDVAARPEPGEPDMGPSIGKPGGRCGIRHPPALVEMRLTSRAPPCGVRRAS